MNAADLDFQDRLRLVANQLALLQFGVYSWLEVVAGQDRDFPKLNALYGACETFARLQSDLYAIAEDYQAVPRPVPAKPKNDRGRDAAATH